MEKIFPTGYGPVMDTKYGVDPVQPTGQPAQPTEPPPPELTDAQIEAALPKPCGYKLLIAMPIVEDTYKGTGLLKTESAKSAETITSVVAAVLDMGPDCYPVDKYPGGPWCKVGDYVIMRPYQGTRFICGRREFRLVNDDGIDGVVQDPTLYQRV